MSYVHAQIPMDANKIAKMMGNGLITNDSSHQRAALDWNREIKTKAISSGIMDIPFPPLYARREKIDGKNYYRLIDGGHRSETYRSYINNEWAAVKSDPITFLNEVTGEYEVVDISFKIFSELPVAVRDKILNTSFQMIFFDNLTREEEVELFRRLNSGKALSAKEKMVANIKDIDNVLNIGEHPLFKDMYTSLAVQKKSHVGVIMKVWCMLNEDISTISFETRSFAEITKRITIGHDERIAMENLFSYIMQVHSVISLRGCKSVAKKLYTETHFVSISPFAKSAMDAGISAEQFADWIQQFYDSETGASSSDQYNLACGGGVAKSANISIRNQCLLDSYQKYFG